MVSMPHRAPLAYTGVGAPTTVVTPSARVASASAAADRRRVAAFVRFLIGSASTLAPMTKPDSGTRQRHTAVTGPAAVYPGRRIPARNHDLATGSLHRPRTAVTHLESQSSATARTRQ
jgi:hypothetical protein